MKNEYKVGSNVNITNEILKKLYGVTDNQEFEVKQVFQDSVQLTNGWIVSVSWVKLVDAVPQKKTDKVLKDIELEKLDEYVFSVIDDFTADNLAFTVYDVTKKLRELLPEYNIKHDLVRKSVEYYYLVEGNHPDSPFFGNVYKRSLIDIGVPVKPYLYHTNDFDPKYYKPNVGAQAALPVVKINPTKDNLKKLSEALLKDTKTQDIIWGPDNSSPTPSYKFVTVFGK